MPFNNRSCRYVLLLVAVAVAGCAPAPQDPIPEIAEEVVAKLRESAGKSSGGGGTKAQVGDGWGTLTGTIRLAAAPAPLAGPDIGGNKDTAYCQKFDPKDETLVTGDGNALANAVVYLRTSTQVHESYDATTNAEVELDNKGCKFIPHIAAMRVTQTLVVKNSDPGVGHNTKLASLIGNGFNSSVPQGSPLRRGMVAAERSPAPVSCEIHTWMRGYVLILGHPYMQVTDASGKFRMENLPAGIELEFQVWHERASSGLTGSANHRVNDRGRFKVTIPKDKTIDFQMTVPLSAVRATPQ